VANDALLIVSFGGPEGPDDVMPFLQNVTRGRDVPPKRLEAVASQYFEFGGVSPINQQNRELVAAVRRAVDVPVYWGNRNWHPLLADTVRQMRDDGIRRATAFVTSAFSSYSSCRQYLEDIAAARAEVGPGAPEVVKIGPYFDHPGFITPLAEGLGEARRQAGPDAPVLMTAHSIPLVMAAACDYESQLRQAAALVAAAAGEPAGAHALVFQSRSGPPTQRWLGPDIEAAIESLPAGVRSAIVVPIGFVSDHMEVVYDLDRKAAATAAARGIKLVRSRTPGVHPAFVKMVSQLARQPEAADPRWCAAGCCPAADG
jgi:ferrochelatase